MGIKKFKPTNSFIKKMQVVNSDELTKGAKPVKSLTRFLRSQLLVETTTVESLFVTEVVV